MNEHLQQRIQMLLARYETATLATCGPAGPQISRLAYQAADETLYLFVAHGSDHLFNLETQPELMLLTPDWKLSGRGLITEQAAITPPHDWQTVITVQPARLHILSENSQQTVETIDF